MFLDFGQRGEIMSERAKMKKEQRKQQKVKPKAPARLPEGPMVAFKPKNYLLLGAGVIAIVAGFVLLSMGSTRVAPLLLVTGYCVLVPLGLLLK